MGFVLVLLILLRLDRIHTRLDSLRAANSSLPLGALSVASFLSLCVLFVVFPRVTAEHSVGPACCFFLSFAFSSLLSLLLAGR